LTEEPVGGCGRSGENINLKSGEEVEGRRKIK